MDLASSFMLNNGVEIPALGLGVFQAEPGQETHDAVLHALETGYRHIDTARVYRNERAVGDALRESSVPRSELFVTTKLWNGDQGFVDHDAKDSLRDSSQEGGVEMTAQDADAGKEQGGASQAESHGKTRKQDGKGKGKHQKGKKVHHEAGIRREDTLR